MLKKLKLLLFLLCSSGLLNAMEMDSQGLAGTLSEIEEQAHNWNARQIAGRRLTTLMYCLKEPAYNHYFEYFLDQLNEQTPSGYTALMAAALIENEAIVERLLQEGADVSVTSKYGKTAFDYARKQLAKAESTENAEDIQSCQRILHMLQHAKESSTHADAEMHKDTDSKQVDCESDPDLQSDSDRYFTYNEFAFDEEQEHELQGSHKHRKADHKSNKTVVGYTCKQCGVTCRNGSHLNYHIMAKHTHERPYQCPECYFAARTKSNLNAHVRKHHEKKNPFGCKYCSYSAVTKNALARHMKQCKKYNANQNMQKTQSREQETPELPHEPVELSAENSPACIVNHKRKRSIGAQYDDYEVEIGPRSQQYICDVSSCKRSFARTSDLTRHKKYHESNSQNGQDTTTHGTVIDDVGSSAVKKIALSSRRKKPRFKEFINAIEKDDYERIKACIDQGVDVNKRYLKGRTALMYAVELGHIAIIQLLLEHGADVNAKDSDGATVLHIISPIKLDTVQMLINHGADVNGKDDEGRTPLMYAIKYAKDIDLTSLLINKADIEARDNAGRTALIRAAQFGERPEIMKLLLENGAYVNAENCHGQTALFEAARNGEVDLVKLLLLYHADPNIRTNRGHTALWIAWEAEYQDVMKILLEYNGKY